MAQCKTKTQAQSSSREHDEKSRAPLISYMAGPVGAGKSRALDFSKFLKIKKREREIIGGAYYDPTAIEIIDDLIQKAEESKASTDWTELIQVYKALPTNAKSQFNKYLNRILSDLSFEEKLKLVGEEAFGYFAFVKAHSAEETASAGSE